MLDRKAGAKSDMKTLLLQPVASFKIIWGKFYKGGGFVPPIGLMSIAAYVREKGHKIDMLDPGVEGIGAEGLKKLLKEGRYDIVGIPPFTNTAMHTFKTAGYVRQVLPKALIVLGGVHATVLPEQTLQECPEADIVVFGEGEITFLELLEWRLKKDRQLSDIDGIVYRDGPGLKRTRPRMPIMDLDSIPMPAYDLLKMQRYIPHATQYKRLPSFSILLSRGCPFSCTFCSASKVHGHRLRLRGLDNVFREIDLLVERYGAKGLYIQDSNLIQSRAYMAEFCQRLRNRPYKLPWMCNVRLDQVDEDLAMSMKAAGCWQVTAGVESANESSLKLIRKQQDKTKIKRGVGILKKSGIKIIGTFILGLPQETQEQVENTINFARKLAIPAALFFLPVPYPGTELLKQCREGGGFREDAAWDDYNSTDFSNPVYVSPLLGKDRMLAYYNKAHLKFYTSPKVLLANILSIRSFEDIKRYGRALNAVSSLWLR